MDRVQRVVGVLLLLLGSFAYGSKCPDHESITRHVLCYYHGQVPLADVNLCNCTHVVLTNAVRVVDNHTLDLVEGARDDLSVIDDAKPSLKKIFSLNVVRDIDSNALQLETRRIKLANAVANLIGDLDANGVELNFPFEGRGEGFVSRDDVTAFVKTLKRRLQDGTRLRVKREGYDVSEKVHDDVTTAAYRTPATRTNRNSEKAQTIKKSGSKRRKSSRRLPNGDRKGIREERSSRRRRTEGTVRRSLLLVRLPVDPEIIAKKFDLKALSEYVNRHSDMLIVSTHNITDRSETELTYHPSRLMGLSDMLNADSILDFLTGLGAIKSNLVLTIPATVLKFQLKDSTKTTPRSPAIGDPEVVDQTQLCSLLSRGNWTVERDEDQTAPYAFADRTWLAYEDILSVNIKAKYIILRELAGGAIYPIDADAGDDRCNSTAGTLTSALYNNIKSLARKPRALVLDSLQQDIRDVSYSNLEAGVHLSEYRITRVVDHSGAVHVIRKNMKTEFECSRQGYFSHPLGCNKFYRCVKFNQYTDDYTVFEYDCPAGLAFDERWEVCVWPGSLPHGAPCTGSSEIAPVPRAHYQCPNHEGYYADPENCRWFFACLDHARDGVTPLTAYEFRCPFGLVFNEKTLACDWPWNVGACGNRGLSGVVYETHGGASSSFQSATFIGGGGSAGGAGYIAGHFDDHQDRASFGTIPEYEVSGGRALNHGGVVLKQSVRLDGLQGSGVSEFFGAQRAVHGARIPVVPVLQTKEPEVRGFDAFLFNGTASAPRPFSLNVPTQEHPYVGSSTTARPETLLLINSGQSGVSGHAAGQYSVQVTTPSPVTVEQGGHTLSTAYVQTGQSGASDGSYVTTFTPRPTVETFSTFGGVALKDHSSGAAAHSQEGFVIGVYDTSNGTDALLQQAILSGSTPYQPHRFFLKEDRTSVLVQPNYSVEEPSVSFEAQKVLVPGHVSHRFEQSHAVGPTVLKQPVTYQKTSTVSARPIFAATPKPDVGEKLFQFSTPSGFTLQKETLQQPAVTTPSTLLYKGAEYQHGEGVSVQTNGFAYSPVVSTPSPEIYVTPTGEYLSSARGESVVQQNNFVASSPAPPSYVTVGQSKDVSYSRIVPVAPTPAPPLFKGDEYLPPAGGLPQSGLVKTVQQNVVVSTAAPQAEGEVTLLKTTHLLQSPVASTPAPPVQVGDVFNVQQKTFVPVYEKQEIVPEEHSGQGNLVVSTPAPAVFKGDGFLTGQEGFTVVKSVEQKVVPTAISTTGPQVFNNDHLIPAGGSGQSNVNVVKTTVQQNSFVSSPAPAVVEYLASVGQPDAIVKSVQQSNVPVVSSAVFKGDAYLPPAGQSSQTLVKTQSKILQPVVSTATSAVYPSGDLLKTVQQNGFVSVVSSPAPEVYKGEGEYLSGQFGQEVTLVKTDKVAQPVVTTPAPVTYTRYTPSVGALGGHGQFGSTLKSILQQETYKVVGANGRPLFTPAEHLRSNDVVSTPSPLFTPAQYDVSVSTALSEKDRFQNAIGASLQSNVSPVVKEGHDLSTYTFVPSTTVRPVTYTYEQERRQKPKQLFSSVLQQPIVVPAQVSTPAPQYEISVTTPRTVYYSSTPTPSTYVDVSHKTPAPTAGEIFGYRSSTPSPLLETVSVSTPQEYAIVSQVATEKTPTTPKPNVLVSTGEQIIVQQEPVELYSSQHRGEVSKEGSSIAGYGQANHFKQPIVVTEKQNVLQQILQSGGQEVRKEPKTVYYENYERNNPAIAYVNGQAYLFSTNGPGVITRVEEIKGDSDYVTQTGGEDVADYGDFDFRKVVDGKVVNSPSVVTTYQSGGAGETKTIYQGNVLTSYQGGDGGNSATAYQAGDIGKIVTTYQAGHADNALTSQSSDGGNSATSYQTGDINKVVTAYQSGDAGNSATGYQSGDIGKVVTTYQSGDAGSIVTGYQSGDAGNSATGYQSGDINKVVTTYQSDDAGSIVTGYQSGDGGQTVTTYESGAVGGEAGKVKYAVNSNIEIAPPPQEYLLQILQNGYTSNSNVDAAAVAGAEQSTTPQPVYVTSTTEGYVYSGDDSRRKDGKATIISVGQVNSEELDEENVESLLQKYSGDFGNVLHGAREKFVTKVVKGEEKGEITVGSGSSTVGYDVTTSRPRSRAHVGESESGKTTLDLKNLKLDKNKKTVIVVSQVSDANPLLIGKLAGQCSCQSNQIQIRKKGSKAGKTTEGYVLIDGSRVAGKDIGLGDQASPTSTTESLTKTGRVLFTPEPTFQQQSSDLDIVSGNDIGFPLFTPVPADKIASTVGYTTVKEVSRVTAGPAFDRYGPGGLRDLDETLQGTVDCERPGLFRHPKHCNKFYACNYDPWKKRYTLHVFNCPIHLSYDSSISACNWPSKGPACAGDNLLI